MALIDFFSSTPFSIQPKFIERFIFNRKYFHATPGAISCILWGNEEEYKEYYDLEVYDIIKNENGEEKIIYIDDFKVKKVNNNISFYNDLREFDNDKITELVCNTYGTLIENYVYIKGRKPLLNENIIGYIFYTNWLFVKSGGGKSSVTLRDSKLDKRVSRILCKLKI